MRTLTLFLLLVSSSAFAQKQEFIGEYIRMQEHTDDTAVHLYFSRGSLIEVDYVKNRKGRDAWLQMKRGTWIISDSGNYEYFVTAIYNDSTVRKMHFVGSFLSPPPYNNGEQPDHYSLDIDGHPFSKNAGKGGFGDVIKRGMKSQQM